MTQRALVIDDDPIQLALARAFLAKRGFEIAVASGKADILSADWNVDLIMTDLNMPDFDGVEFIEVLRQREYQGRLIIVSGANEAVRRAASSLANVYGLQLLGMIAKPLTAEKLDAALSGSP